MSPPLRFAPFEIRPDERRLLRDGEPVRLGARAFDVLLALVERAGRLVTKAELLDLAWPGLVVEEANIQVQMSTLRKLLGAQSVATIPGLGYRFAMPVQGLPHGEPAEPAAAPAPRGLTNLGEALDDLIGRDEDLAALLEAMQAHRLVTLAGAGGIGKTRLAQAAARASLASCPRGAWWVDLAALSDPRSLAGAVAQAIGLSLGGGETPAALARALRGGDGRLLVVLDNCEHLVEAAAGTVRELLDGCLDVAVLATSREPLKLRAEHVHALAPLALPPPGATVDEARRSGALRLFEARAAAVDRRFVLDADNLAPAIALCRRLDGLPLAIEMAAVRAPLLGLAVLHQQLAERLDVLKTDRRDAPMRHRSLRLTLDWSHALLDAAEAAVLRRLSVFAGSFALETAQETACSDAIDRWAVTDALQGLVDQSLVKLESLAPPRYRLLETTRRHARERLAQAGEATSTWQRHLAAMAALAGSIVAPVRSGRLDDWIARHLHDYDDMALAFEHACDWGEADAGARLATALRNIDQVQGLFANSGRRALRAGALLERAGPASRGPLARFIASCGWVEVPGHPHLACARIAVRAAREQGDTVDLFDALCLLVTKASGAGAHDEAAAALAEARSLEQPDWPPRRAAYRSVHEGWGARFRGDAQGYVDAMQCAAEGFASDGLHHYALTARGELVLALLLAGRPADAQALARTLLAEPTIAAQPERRAMVQLFLAATHALAGDVVRARPITVQLLALGDGFEHSRCELVALAAAVLAAGDTAPDAGRLLGCVDAARQATPTQTYDAEIAQRLGERTAEELGCRLGAGRLAGLRAEGRQLDLPQGLALARRRLGAG